MALSAKFIRTQLGLLLPLVSNLSLESSRKGQEKIGQIMGARHRGDVVIKHHSFENFEGAWVLPRDKRRQGVMLYLHGGGYTCGNLEYATGFASTLAHECGMRLFAPAYRLAPEHPFPAALEDACAAYEYLLRKGYPAGQIALCGESAGGGLCYSLCVLLKQRKLPLPGGIIAISPWTDLTASGPSYEENREKDPSMTAELLNFFADCYTQDRQNPLVSPLFADLTGLPPSLIFAGGDEIMLSDSHEMHARLTQQGCKSQLNIAPERWHGYVLYGLEENKEDIPAINQFLNRHIAQERKLRWTRLDNAAKLYPAVRSKRWSNVFRLSATLTEEVDVSVLETALDITVRRFPTIAARLRRGVFWYYLEQLPKAPAILAESSSPLAHMDKKEMRRCAFRVIVYGSRVAVEFFHSLTDGSGGLIFLKTLLAEYVHQKYGVYIPAEKGVLNRLDEPKPQEMEDSFLKYAADVSASRKESNAWRISGTPEPDDYRNLVCLQTDTKAALEAAHRCGVSLTAFLCAVLMQAIMNMQKEQVPFRRLRKPVKVLIPVNLRGLFPSSTLRNFALYTTPELDPQLGDYSFEEICKIVYHHMGMTITPKQMSTRIATNVQSERSLIVRAMPLFIKNLVMKAVFDAVGEKKSCLSMSNLGAIALPDALAAYVERFDFVLGTQATAPHNCGIVSYNGKLNINFIRNIRESELELHVFRVLQQRGLEVTVQSNGRP